ncbi:MAG: hypothetical protein SF187_03025 [Deltaproteobacteria bacterium]|nr:hypothetical protein [Deltaproteobacteria bacterium]
MIIDVAYVDPGPHGYSPYLHLAQLASEAFGGKCLRIPAERPSRLEKFGALWPQKRGNRACLFIAHAPGALKAFAAIPRWRAEYRYLCAWVFDSFWVDHVSRFVRYAQPFDHVYVTEAEDLEAWRQKFKVPVDWLPWGADVLRMGSTNAHRNVDACRIGRQPPAWEDDSATAAAFAARGLTFKGRPTGDYDPLKNQEIVAAHFSQSKFSLSFSNSVSPSVQTHPHRQYITARWTDALACGVTVAGVPPQCRTIDELLWPEALLKFESIDLDHGIERLREAVSQWTPARAQLNHVRALERLDWRLRLQKVAANAGAPVPPALAAGLSECKARVAAYEAANPAASHA